MRCFGRGVSEARGRLHPKLEVVVELKEANGLQAVVWDRSLAAPQLFGDVEVCGRDEQACAQLAQEVRKLVNEWCEFAVACQVDAAAYLAGSAAAEELRLEVEAEEAAGVDLVVKPRAGAAWHRCWPGRKKR